MKDSLGRIRTPLSRATTAVYTTRMAIVPAAEEDPV